MDTRNKRLTPIVASLMIGGAIALAGCGKPDGGNASSVDESTPPYQGNSGDDSGPATVIFLDQGFTDDDRRALVEYLKTLR